MSAKSNQISTIHALRFTVHGGRRVMAHDTVPTRGILFVFGYHAMLSLKRTRFCWY